MKNDNTYRIYTFGDPDADIMLLQLVDGHDLEGMEQELDYIRRLSPSKDFCLTAVQVNHWNLDLSPWQAPAVFGKDDFGGGAADTLQFLLDKVLPNEEADGRRTPRIYLGGYSLAGLFALWTGFQTNRFAGIAAASPSLWFPGFVSYMREQLQKHPLSADAVYLSLGNREEKTRNPVMSQVGRAVRETYSLLKDSGIESFFEWNPGNHFQDPELRTAKGFAWLVNHSFTY